MSETEGRRALHPRIEELLEHLDEAALVDASGVALGSITHPHPFFGTLDMYQWVLALGWHDLRHAEQVREMSHAASSD